MAKIIKVSYKDLEVKEFEAGLTLKEISKSFKNHFNYPILVSKVDNNIEELNETINRSCNIEFYDRSSGLGNGIYGRTLQFMIIVAIKRLYGKETEVIIHYSIDKGFFCEVIGVEIDKSSVKEIENEIRKLSKEDLIINKVSVSRFDAIKYFKKNKQIDKVKVLKYISNSYINLYRIDNIYDYFYGELAYSTKDIDDFALTYINGNGFVASYPDTYNPECTLNYKHHEMLFNTFYDYTKWGNQIGINNAADLNEVVSTGEYNRLIHVAETYYNNQLSKIADEIYNNRKRIKIVLIAGPSSSGKTTTSKKLEIHLQSKGIKTHQISIDDYFLDRERNIFNGVQFSCGDLEILA